MRSIVVAVFVFFACLASAVAQPWTAVGSSGGIDEAAAGIYAVGISSLGYLPATGSIAPIVARYNVTSTGSATPAWTTFEILANNANVTNGVVATLYSVSRLTGAVTVLSSIPTAANPGVVATTWPLGTSITFDFNNFYYVVEARIARIVSSDQPALHGVRLY